MQSTEEEPRFEKGYAEGWMDATSCLAYEMFHVGICRYEFMSDECNCLQEADAVAEAGWVALKFDEEPNV